MKLFNQEEIKHLNKVCGIYLIRVNEKEYVGSSVNIYKRFKHHSWSLEKGNHHNSTFTNLFNKYGKDYFECELLQECTIDQLESLEDFYIKSRNPYINHIRDTTRLTRDERYRKNISKSKKKYYANGGKQHNQKKVYQYDLEGNFLKEFESASEAARNLGKEMSSICAVARGKYTSSYGYVWSYKKVEKLSIKKYDYFTRAVVQLDLDNNLIKEWDSMTEAKNSLKINNIQRAIKNNLTAGGFRWKYK